MEQKIWCHGIFNEAQNMSYISSRAVDVQVEILLVFTIQVQHSCYQLIACLFIYCLAEEDDPFSVLHNKQLLIRCCLNPQPRNKIQKAKVMVQSAVRTWEGQHSG